MSFESQCATSY